MESLIDVINGGAFARLKIKVLLIDSVPIDAHGKCCAGMLPTAIILLNISCNFGATLLLLRRGELTDFTVSNEKGVDEWKSSR